MTSLSDANVESVVSLPVVNPDGGTSRTCIYMGKVDRTEDTKVIDWKGVAECARFIRLARIGFQAELYALAVRHGGQDITEIEYRLIRRPQLRYSKPSYTFAVMRIGRKSALKLCDTRKEAERAATMSDASVEVRCKGDANRAAYENRCLNDIIAKDGLVTHNHILTEAKLEQARWYLWGCSKRILDCRTHNRWMPNPRACYAYERECPFADLCDACQNGADYEWIIGDQFQVRDTSHPELKPYVTFDGKTILTFTSCSDLTACEMFYYWKHERRLAKRHDEDSEPLWVGSAVHVGLEALALAHEPGMDLVKNIGLHAACTAIDQWAEHNPVIGEDAFWKQEQQIARARAMVRAAKAKWLSTDSQQWQP